MLHIRKCSVDINRRKAGQGKLEKVKEVEWSGKGQGGNIFLEKSGKLINPGTESFETVRAGCLDSLIEVKLHFILSIAKRPQQPFLKLCQVGKPMMPFLVPDLLQLVKDLLSRFVK